MLVLQWKVESSGINRFFNFIIANAKCLLTGIRAETAATRAGNRGANGPNTPEVRATDANPTKNPANSGPGLLGALF